jgi:hypothetical protein
MGTTTSVLWKRERSPQWGDQALTRGLEQWGKNISPIEAKFLFRGLIYSTLAVPIEPGSDPMQEGTVLRLAQDANGRWGIPVFTHPEQLAKFAISVGWTTPGQEIPWTAVQGREAFKTLSEVDGIECWVNPASSSLRLNQQALKQLAEGEIPDPRNLGATVQRQAVTGGVANPEYRALSVPDRLSAAVKLVLESLPEVTSASYFQPPMGQVTIGIKCVGQNPVSHQNALRALEKILSKSGDSIAVVVIDSALERLLNEKAIQPFYWRRS